MGFRINTNIAAMNSHRNAMTTNAGLDKSLNSLSSGLRINTAADDASGMTIADSLRSQAKGLGQAINNANDGVAVVQTADGALDEYINIINTVRTKAIQAASDGQNTDSRAAIQADIDRLLEAANGIANTTQFNGQKLLDGTFTNKAFHIGAYAGETVSLSVGNVQTDSVGGVTSTVGGTSRAAFAPSTDLSETTAGYSLATNALTINGTDVSSSLNTLSPTRLTDAASVAAAITDATGLIADASNTLTGAAAVTAGTIDSSNEFKINGIAIADTTVLAGDSDGSLVRAINDISDQTGVTATLDDNSKLVLESIDGSNISITGQDYAAQTDTYVLSGTFASAVPDTIQVQLASGADVTYSVTAADAGDIDTMGANLVAALNADNTFASVATATYDAASKSFVITNNDSALDGVADAVTVTTTTAGDGADDGGTNVAADATLASKAITGLTADNLTDKTGTNAIAALAGGSTSELVIAEGELVINGVDMAGTYGDNVTADDASAKFLAAIQAIDGMEDSSINALGNLKLVVNDGQDLNIAGTTGPGTFGFTENVYNESKAGKIEIFSNDAVLIGGAAETSFGLTEGSNKVTDNGSSLESIDVTTRDSAEVAILITDSALLQLDATRADLGSVQNQLESTIRNISVTQVNVTAAESQIRDVDFAAESANFAKLNILAQSGSYAMSQANAVQQNVLRLLQ